MKEVGLKFEVWSLQFDVYCLMKDDGTGEQEGEGEGEGEEGKERLRRENGSTINQYFRWIRNSLKYPL